MGTERSELARARFAILPSLLSALLAACESSTAPQPRDPLDPALVAEGREIFRYDTFGDEAYWTDTLRMHEIVESAVSPRTALAVGLKVDVDALPASLRQAIAAGDVDLDDPGHHARAAATERCRRAAGRGRDDRRKAAPDAAGHHVCPVSFNGGQLVGARPRQAAGRLGQP